MVQYLKKEVQEKFHPIMIRGLNNHLRDNLVQQMKMQMVYIKQLPQILNDRQSVMRRLFF